MVAPERVWCQSVPLRDTTVAGVQARADQILARSVIVSLGSAIDSDKKLGSGQASARPDPGSPDQILGPDSATGALFRTACQYVPLRDIDEAGLHRRAR